MRFVSYGGLITMNFMASVFVLRVVYLHVNIVENVLPTCSK